ncbi:hypothetical protein Rhopal_000880-T1 [Rhodotorula paludigena]|uniref:Proteophosphoglycan ppg4 n=1 Tax=Rhodotorula paludigena TaxID=86838 RepID=A0AAV5GDV4_9BASI|nr:hypothetical protein Rhopal_000880-T1 [Rhodotorula paludigena]
MADQEQAQEPPAAPAYPLVGTVFPSLAAFTAYVHSVDRAFELVEVRKRGAHARTALSVKCKLETRKPGRRRAGERRKSQDELCPFRISVEQQDPSSASSSFVVTASTPHAVGPHEQGWTAHETTSDSDYVEDSTGPSPRRRARRGSTAGAASADPSNGPLLTRDSAGRFASTSPVLTRPPTLLPAGVEPAPSSSPPPNTIQTRSGFVIPLLAPTPRSRFCPEQKLPRLRPRASRVHEGDAAWETWRVEVWRERVRAGEEEKEWEVEERMRETGGFGALQAWGWCEGLIDPREVEQQQAAAQDNKGKAEVENGACRAGVAVEHRALPLGPAGLEDAEDDEHGFGTHASAGEPSSRGRGRNRAHARGRGAQRGTATTHTEWLPGLARSSRGATRPVAEPDDLDRRIGLASQAAKRDDGNVMDVDIANPPSASTASTSRPLLVVDISDMRCAPTDPPPAVAARSFGSRPFLSASTAGIVDVQTPDTSYSPEEPKPLLASFRQHGEPYSLDDAHSNAPAHAYSSASYVSFDAHPGSLSGDAAGLQKEHDALAALLSLGGQPPSTFPALHLPGVRLPPIHDEPPPATMGQIEPSSRPPPATHAAPPSSSLVFRPRQSSHALPAPRPSSRPSRQPSRASSALSAAPAPLRARPGSSGARVGLTFSSGPRANASVASPVPTLGASRAMAVAQASAREKDMEEVRQAQQREEEAWARRAGPGPDEGESREARLSKEDAQRFLESMWRSGGQEEGGRLDPLYDASLIHKKIEQLSSSLSYRPPSAFFHPASGLYVSLLSTSFKPSRARLPALASIDSSTAPPAVQRAFGDQRTRLALEYLYGRAVDACECAFLEQRHHPVWRLARTMAAVAEVNEQCRRASYAVRGGSGGEAAWMDRG